MPLFPGSAPVLVRARAFTARRYDAPRLASTRYPRSLTRAVSRPAPAPSLILGPAQPGRLWRPRGSRGGDGDLCHTIGTVIAADERRILPGPSRFDAYVQAVLNNDPAAMRRALTPEEVAGLRLFIGKARCINCHNGPLLTDTHFHNTGIPARAGLPPDIGRAKGAQQVRDDEFNCVSRSSDARPEDCVELRSMVAGVEVEGAFKPSSAARYR